ncbi:MAG: hypothetical protein ACXVPD_05025 [Bacteroidia bacterium]
MERKKLHFLSPKYWEEYLTNLLTKTMAKRQNKNDEQDLAKALQQSNDVLKSIKAQCNFHDLHPACKIIEANEQLLAKLK